MISKKIYYDIKNYFIKIIYHLKNVFCTSYIKSLGLIKKLRISDLQFFHRYWFKKSSLSIFKIIKLLYY